METIFNVVFYSLIATYAILIAIFLIRKIKGIKILNAVFLALIIVYAIVRLLIVPFEYDFSAPNNTTLFYLVFAIMTVAIVILSIVFDKEKLSFNSKAISYAGICIALSYALSFIKIEFLGGSITLASALPLIIYSYVFGSKKGTIIGVIFGILQFIQKATVYHPVQGIIDYPLAFGAIGLSGIFMKTKLSAPLKFVLGAIVGLFSRYVCHVVSGYFIFGIYAGYYGFNSPLIYSIVYNMNVLIDLAIVILSGIFLFSSKSFVKALNRIDK